MQPLNGFTYYFLKTLSFIKRIYNIFTSEKDEYPPEEMDIRTKKLYENMNKDWYFMADRTFRDNRRPYQTQDNEYKIRRFVACLDNTSDEDGINGYRLGYDYPIYHSHIVFFCLAKILGPTSELPINTKGLLLSKIRNDLINNFKREWEEFFGKEKPVPEVYITKMYFSYPNNLNKLIPFTVMFVGYFDDFSEFDYEHRMWKDNGSCKHRLNYEDFEKVNEFLGKAYNASMTNYLHIPVPEGFVAHNPFQETLYDFHQNELGYRKTLYLSCHCHDLIEGYTASEIEKISVEDTIKDSEVTNYDRFLADGIRTYVYFHKNFPSLV